MTKSQSENQSRKSKSIKNIYIHKINSLMKIMGESHKSLPCLSQVRKTVSSESREGWIQQRKQNNKDAARKARERKKIYMDLLEQSLANMQELNQESKALEKSTNQLLASIKRTQKEKQQDDIGQYLIQEEFAIKNVSQATVASQKQNELNKIVREIQRNMFPQELCFSKIDYFQETSYNITILNKIKESIRSIPEVFSELRSICSDQVSLRVTSEPNLNMNQRIDDSYFFKTLMEEFYSKTICRKDSSSNQVHYVLNLLTKVEKHCIRSQQISQN